MNATNEIEVEACRVSHGWGRRQGLKWWVALWLTLLLVAAGGCDKKSEDDSSEDDSAEVEKKKKKKKRKKKSDDDDDDDEDDDDAEPAAAKKEASVAELLAILEDPSKASEHKKTAFALIKKGDAAAAEVGAWLVKMSAQIQAAPASKRWDMSKGYHQVLRRSRQFGKAIVPSLKTVNQKGSSSDATYSCIELKKLGASCARDR